MTYRFEESRSFTRGAEHNRCSICDGGYDKWTYQYVKVTGGTLLGAVVCPDCLKAAEDGTLQARLNEAAEDNLAAVEHHKRMADIFRQAAAESIDLPTFAEWRKREALADAEYCAAYYAAGVSHED